jgi:chemotaxis protein histidine kinase CheA
MPQPKSSATSAAAKRRTTAAKPKAATASKPAARRTTAASKPAAAKASASAVKKPAASKTAAAKKPAAAAKPSARRASTAKAKPSAAAKQAPPAKPTLPKPSAKRDGDPLTQMVGVLREQLSDASGLVEQLLRGGRGQTSDVAGNLDALLSKGLDQLEQLSRKLEGGTTKARRADSVDRLMRSADRARRAVGVGPSFPILAYGELSVRQITDRLGDLNAAELRKVRDYERRHANRKSLLTAIDKALG